MITSLFNCLNKFTYLNRELFHLTQGVQITEDVLYRLDPGWLILIAIATLVEPWTIEHGELDRKRSWAAEAKQVTPDMMSHILCIFIKFSSRCDTSSKELSLQFIVVSVSYHWLIVIVQFFFLLKKWDLSSLKWQQYGQLRSVHCVGRHFSRHNFSCYLWLVLVLVLVLLAFWGYMAL